MMLRPVPDWQKQHVFLVAPAIWSRYRSGRSDLRPVYVGLVNAVRSMGIEPFVLTKADNPLDIWIRDWGFVESAYFNFAPSYAKGLYGQSALAIARSALDQKSGTRHRSIPMILDGGNLVHDGEVAILTEKALLDNPHLSRLEIERIIISLGFQRAVFIPTEPEDAIGHADGIVRFLSSGELLVNEYTCGFFADYRRRLLKTLKQAKLKAEIVPFPWFSTDEMNDGVWSAVGCYINFIQTTKGIVLPIFGDRRDERAVELLRVHNVDQICSVMATDLARQGGVLNCVTLLF